MLRFILLSTLMIACSHPQKKFTPEAPLPEVPLETNEVKNIVLIQGIHLDELSWQEIKTDLLSQNFNVITPGRIGRDKGLASLKEIATLTCGKIPEKSIIVAHSFGGAITNAMVGICPQKVKQIIYISAVVPLKGEKPFAHISKADQDEFAKAVNYSRNFIRPRTTRTFFRITDPSFQLSRENAPKIYTESMNLVNESIEYDETQFIAVPKSYIYTLKDSVVSLKTQQTYVDRANIKQTSGVETGHFPMLSSPETLGLAITKFIQ